VDHTLIDLVRTRDEVRDGVSEEAKDKNFGHGSRDSDVLLVVVSGHHGTNRRRGCSLGNRT
jgi:hypothetical protein